MLLRKQRENNLPTYIFIQWQRHRLHIPQDLLLTFWIVREWFHKYWNFSKELQLFNFILRIVNKHSHYAFAMRLLGRLTKYPSHTRSYWKTNKQITRQAKNIPGPVKRKRKCQKVPMKCVCLHMSRRKKKTSAGVRGEEVQCVLFVKTMSICTEQHQRRQQTRDQWKSGAGMMERREKTWDFISCVCHLFDIDKEHRPRWGHPATKANTMQLHNEHVNWET